LPRLQGRLKIATKMATGDQFMPQVSIVEAKNGLTRLIQEAERGEPIHITRHGKPAAVLLSEEAYGRLQSPETEQDFWQAVQEWRDKASFDWPELTPEEVDSWRDRSTDGDSSWDD
jgi:prevent-host-death family protein